MALYVNGATSSSTITVDSTSAVRGPSLAASQTYGVGCQPVSGSSAEDFFTGYIDEVRIENVARNADWARLNYATQKAAVTAITYGTVTPPTGIRPKQAFSPDLNLRMTGSSLTLFLPEISSGARVSMMDLRGRVVWSKAVVAGMREVSVGSTSSLGVVPGVYIVRLSMQDGTQKSRIAAESKVLLTP